MSTHFSSSISLDNGLKKDEVRKQLLTTSYSQNAIDWICKSGWKDIEMKYRKVYLNNLGKEVSLAIITEVGLKSDLFEAGIKEGDIIVSIDNYPVFSFEDFEKILHDSKPPFSLSFLRGFHKVVTNWPSILVEKHENNQIFDVTFKDKKLGFKMVKGLKNRGREVNDDPLDGSNKLNPLVSVVEKGLAAFRAGVQKDDKLIALNGIPVTNFNDFTLRYKPDERPVTMTFQRENKEVPHILRSKSLSSFSKSTRWAIIPSIEDHVDHVVTDQHDYFHQPESNPTHPTPPGSHNGASSIQIETARTISTSNTSFIPKVLPMIATLQPVTIESDGTYGQYSLLKVRFHDQRIGMRVVKGTIAPTEQQQSSTTLAKTKAVVSFLAQGLAAFRAGVHLGDTIVAINKTKIDSYEQFQTIYQTTQERPIFFSFLRGYAVNLNEPDGNDDPVDPSLLPLNRSPSRKLYQIQSVEDRVNRPLDVLDTVQPVMSGLNGPQLQLGQSRTSHEEPAMDLDPKSTKRLITVQFDTTKIGMKIIKGYVSDEVHPDNSLVSAYDSINNLKTKPIIASIDANSAGQKAGLQPNEILVAINGNKLNSFEEFDANFSSYDRPVKISFISGIPVHSNPSLPVLSVGKSGAVGVSNEKALSKEPVLPKKSVDRMNPPVAMIPEEPETSHEPQDTTTKDPPPPPSYNFKEADFNNQSMYSYSRLNPCGFDPDVIQLDNDLNQVELLPKSSGNKSKAFNSSAKLLTKPQRSPSKMNLLRSPSNLSEVQKSSSSTTNLSWIVNQNLDTAIIPMMDTTTASPTATASTAQKSKAAFSKKNLPNEATPPLQDTISFSNQRNVWRKIKQSIQNFYATTMLKLSIVVVGCTGSGKSYTLFGKSFYQDRGIIPRFIDEQFSPSDETDGPNPFVASYMTISMYMISKEKIIDLLAPPKTYESTDNNILYSQSIGCMIVPLVHYTANAASQCHQIIGLGLKAAAVITIGTNSLMVNHDHIVVSLRISSQGRGDTEATMRQIDFIEVSSVFYNDYEQVGSYALSDPFSGKSLSNWSIRNVLDVMNNGIGGQVEYNRDDPALKALLHRKGDTSLPSNEEAESKETEMRIIHSILLTHRSLLSYLLHESLLMRCHSIFIGCLRGDAIYHPENAFWMDFIRKIDEFHQTFRQVTPSLLPVPYTPSPSSTTTTAGMSSSNKIKSRSKSFSVDPADVKVKEHPITMESILFECHHELNELIQQIDEEKKYLQRIQRLKSSSIDKDETAVGKGSEKVSIKGKWIEILLHKKFFLTRFVELYEKLYPQYSSKSWLNPVGPSGKAMKSSKIGRSLRQDVTMDNELSMKITVANQRVHEGLHNWLERQGLLLQPYIREDLNGEAVAVVHRWGSSGGSGVDNHSVSSGADGGGGGSYGRDTASEVMDTMVMPILPWQIRGGTESHDPYLLHLSCNHVTEEFGKVPLRSGYMIVKSSERGVLFNEVVQPSSYLLEEDLKDFQLANLFLVNPVDKKEVPADEGEETSMDQLDGETIHTASVASYKKETGAVAGAVGGAVAVEEEEVRLSTELNKEYLAKTFRKQVVMNEFVKYCNDVKDFNGQYGGGEGLEVIPSELLTEYLEKLERKMKKEQWDFNAFDPIEDEGGGEVPLISGLEERVYDCTLPVGIPHTDMDSDLIYGLITQRLDGVRLLPYRWVKPSLLFEKKKKNQEKKKKRRKKTKTNFAFPMIKINGLVVPDDIDNWEGSDSLFEYNAIDGIVLHDQDVIQFGYNRWMKVFIPKQSLEIKQLIQLTGQRKAKSERKKLNKLNISNKIYTQWEKAICLQYKISMKNIIFDYLKNRRLIEHLQVNRELNAILKIYQRNELMKRIDFDPLDQEVEEYYDKVFPMEMLKMVGVICITSVVNYMSRRMKKPFQFYVVFRPPYQPVNGSSSSIPYLTLNDLAIYCTSATASVQPVNSVSPIMTSSYLPTANMFGFYPQIQNFTIQTPDDDDELVTETEVDVADTSTGSWIWTLPIFMERSFHIDDMYNTFTDYRIVNQNLRILRNLYPVHKDPYYSSSEDELIGVGFLYLDRLLHLLDIDETVRLINFDGQIVGALKLTIRAWIDTIGPIPSYITADRATHLVDHLDHKLILNLYFESLSGLPPDHCSRTFCYFKFLKELPTYQTPRCDESQPFLNHTVQIVETVTPSLIQYIASGCLEIEVFGQKGKKMKNVNLSSRSGMHHLTERWIGEKRVRRGTLDYVATGYQMTVWGEEERSKVEGEGVREERGGEVPILRTGSSRQSSFNGKMKSNQRVGHDEGVEDESRIELKMKKKPEKMAEGLNSSQLHDQLAAEISHLSKELVVKNRLLQRSLKVTDGMMNEKKRMEARYLSTTQESEQKISILMTERDLLAKRLDEVEQRYSRMDDNQSKGPRSILSGMSFRSENGVGGPISSGLSIKNIFSVFSSKSPSEGTKSWKGNVKEERGGGAGDQDQEELVQSDISEDTNEDLNEVEAEANNQRRRVEVRVPKASLQNQASRNTDLSRVSTSTSIATKKPTRETATSSSCRIQ